MPNDLEMVRNTKPIEADHLWDWVEGFTGIEIARDHVCLNHTPPFEAFAYQVLKRPKYSLWLGSRGSGKSFLSAIDTHITSRFHKNAGTRILGGSLAQSEQIYGALKKILLDGYGPLGNDRASVKRLLHTIVEYYTGSDVAMLAASETSVRGPHIPSLKLDEVDEIDTDLRQDSLGTCMNMNGLNASILMTSTWHRVGGPMADLMEEALAGKFPQFTFCVFEVLQRCDSERSGRWVGGEAGYEKCPLCPLKPWCHAERDRNGDVPLAKKSNGHYDIETLIQKLMGVNIRMLEADYLCKGAKAEGLWFTDFDEDKNVSVDAEFAPWLPMHIPTDPGVHSASVGFQVRDSYQGHQIITVCWDYYKEGLFAEENARAALAVNEQYANGKKDKVSMDLNSTSRNAVGPNIQSEYEKVGLKSIHGIESWPYSRVTDSLAKLEALIKAADGKRRLLIHPRCKHTINALKSYRRKKFKGQWTDDPEDPQHPAEDLVDALRGGIAVSGINMEFFTLGAKSAREEKKREAPQLGFDDIRNRRGEYDAERARERERNDHNNRRGLYGR